MLNEFKDYYRAELDRFEEEVKVYAALHDRTAGRLHLTDRASRDPHVERLIQSMAFLAARIEKKLDSEFPQLTDAMLEILYPNMARPIPSVAIVQVQPDDSITEKGKKIDRHSRFIVESGKGGKAKGFEFRSTTDLKLWPLSITSVSLNDVDAKWSARHPGSTHLLRIRLRVENGFRIGELELDRLRFQITGSAPEKHDLFGLLTCFTTGVELASGEGPDQRIFDVTRRMTTGAFSPDEAILDHPRKCFDGFRLLQEYFTCPDKFLCFDIEGFGDLAGVESCEVELTIGFSRGIAFERSRLSENTFKLFCLPLVNLFSHDASPISLTGTVEAYPVHLDEGLESYDIIEVRDTADPDIVYEPFFRQRHGEAGPESSADDMTGKRFFLPVWRDGSPSKKSARLHLSLVDQDMILQRDGVKSVSIKVRATNGDRPSRWTGWRTDEQNIAVQDPGGRPITELGPIRLESPPSASMIQPLGRRGQWRLTSLLSQGLLSVLEDNGAGLRNLLKAVDPTPRTSREKYIDGIVRVTADYVNRRIQTSQGTAVARGYLIELILDPDGYPGRGAILFASVLDRFFAALCPVNFFTQVALKSSDEASGIQGLKPWPPRSGEKELL